MPIWNLQPVSSQFFTVEFFIKNNQTSFSPIKVSHYVPEISSAFTLNEVLVACQLNAESNLHFHNVGSTSEGSFTQVVKAYSFYCFVIYS